jgi:hypothetical protein
MSIDIGESKMFGISQINFYFYKVSIRRDCGFNTNSWFAGPYNKFKCRKTFDGHLQFIDYGLI